MSSEGFARTFQERPTGGNRRENWGGLRDLNPRPPVPQTGALPTELKPPSNQKEQNGAPDRTRTCDPRLRRPMLYPAELRALIPKGAVQHRRASTYAMPGRLRAKWSGRRDSNPRHPAPKAGALPDCATPRSNLLKEHLPWQGTPGRFRVRRKQISYQQCRRGARRNWRAGKRVDGYRPSPRPGSAGEN